MVSSSGQVLSHIPKDADLLARHWNDPNFDFEDIRSLPDFSVEETRHSIYKSSTSDFDVELQVDSEPRPQCDEDSPYAEVRAAVPNIDDQTMPCNTFRVWTIGCIFCIFISGANQLLNMRYPSVTITSVFAQLVALPIAKLMEWALPTRRFTTFGYTWSLNPGPFNVKEHTVITVMAMSVEGGVYGTDLILAQRLFYGQKFGFSYDIMIALSSQIMGYSLGGLVRPILVWPASMIWPGALVNAALFSTLHKGYRVREKNHMSREKFLFLVVLGSFLWYWVPGLLWTGLSVFNWVCWIAPTNVVVNVLFGTTTGLGMGVLTFDWAMISFVENPLVTPWWAQLNMIASFVFFQWLIVPIIYFTNTWDSAFMPASTSTAFDNTGSPYNISAVVTNGVFDEDKYRKYSPVYLPAVFAMAYCLDMAGNAAVLVHTPLWYGRDILRQFRQSLQDQPDVHSRLMLAYRQVPQWWYAIIFLTSFILGAVVIEKFHTDLPIWAFCICIAFGFIFIVPFGIILAHTNTTIGLNIMSEVIAAYIVPHRPVAVMVFKTFGTVIADQGTRIAASSKLGHYMKVAPRVMFMAQVIASVINCFVSAGVQRWALGHVPDACQPGQKNGFICPGADTFAQASIIYGGVGPDRLFGTHGLYHAVVWFAIIGALSPIPFYFLAKKYPRSIFRYVNMPIFWLSTSYLPPATGINYSSWAVAGFIFQYYMRRYRFMWWMRYNYILSIGLDIGVAFGSLLIFFIAVYPNGGINLNWWGNTVYMNTVDYQGTPLKSLAPGQTFGVKVWS